MSEEKKEKVVRGQVLVYFDPRKCTAAEVKRRIEATGCWTESDGFQSANKFMFRGTSDNVESLKKIDGVLRVLFEASGSSFLEGATDN